MAENRNPAAAGDGDPEADHPGRAIGSEIAHSQTPNQPAPTSPLIRNGNARTCLACGTAIKPQRGSRRQRFCDSRCRSRARRERNFLATGHTGQGAARPVQNSPAISNTRKGENAGRAFPINLVGGHRWPGPNGVGPELQRTIVQTEIGATSIVLLIDNGETGDLIASHNGISRQQTESGSTGPADDGGGAA
jgi:hypothetical protein